MRFILIFLVFFLQPILALADTDGTIIRLEKALQPYFSKNSVHIAKNGQNYIMKMELAQIILPNSDKNIIATPLLFHLSRNENTALWNISLKQSIGIKISDIYGKNLNITLNNAEFSGIFDETIKTFRDMALYARMIDWQEAINTPNNEIAHKKIYHITEASYKSQTINDHDALHIMANITALNLTLTDETDTRHATTTPELARFYDYLNIPSKTYHPSEISLDRYISNIKMEHVVVDHLYQFILDSLSEEQVAKHIGLFEKISIANDYFNINATWPNLFINISHVFATKNLSFKGDLFSELNTFSVDDLIPQSKTISQWALSLYPSNMNITIQTDGKVPPNNLLSSLYDAGFNPLCLVANIITSASHSGQNTRFTVMPGIFSSSLYLVSVEGRGELSDTGPTLESGKITLKNMDQVNELLAMADGPMAPIARTWLSRLAALAQKSPEDGHLEWSLSQPPHAPLLINNHPAPAIFGKTP